MQSNHGKIKKWSKSSCLKKKIKKNKIKLIDETKFLLDHKLFEKKSKCIGR